MNKLIFLQSDNFGNTKCDFYRNNQVKYQHKVKISCLILKMKEDK
ncbi:hypothetical protein [Clostridium sp.]